MSKTTSKEAFSFAKENGFKSFNEMMELLAINTAMEILKELGDEYIHAEGNWQNVDFIVPAMRRIADRHPAEMRSHKTQLIDCIKYNIKNAHLVNAEYLPKRG